MPRLLLNVAKPLSYAGKVCKESGKVSKLILDKVKIHINVNQWRNTQNVLGGGGGGVLCFVFALTFSLYLALQVHITYGW